MKVTNYDGGQRVDIKDVLLIYIIIWFPPIICLLVILMLNKL